MNKLILLIAVILLMSTECYTQPKLDLITYQHNIMGTATATKDTIDITGWAYCKFSIAPIETDSVLQWSFSDFSSTDSMSITQPMVWNQPDWIDTKIYPRIIIKGATDYILTIWGRRY